MDIMAGMSSNAFFIALVQIVAIDIVLGGDNAIIIALACRNLPKKQKRLGILWGTAGAITLRVILVFFCQRSYDHTWLKAARRGIAFLELG